MPVSAETLRRLMAAGVTGDALLGVVESIDADAASAASRLLEEQTAAAARQARYRERVIESRGDMTSGDWSLLRLAVFERDQYVCVYCGIDASMDPQCDHVIPVSKGGGSSVGNLATACRECNSSKKDLTVEEWRGRK